MHDQSDSTSLQASGRRPDRGSLLGKVGFFLALLPTSGTLLQLVLQPG
ncbi:MAG: hypothetical protein ACE149_09630 [Armatimonadota bacterium]